MNDKLLLNLKDEKQFLDLVAKIREEERAFNPSRREFLKNLGYGAAGVGIGGGLLSCKNNITGTGSPRTYNLRIYDHMKGLQKTVTKPKKI